MDIKRRIVAFDAADLEPESTFWSRVLGGSVDVDDDWHMVIVDGEPVVGVQLAPDHRRPDWPDNTVPQQIHLDLWVEDYSSAHDEVIAAGAVLVQALGDGRDFAVYTDPAGHPFCLCLSD